MEEMLATLREIGIPADECARIRERFDGDMDALCLFVLYCRAIYDDRHEYVD